MKDLKGKIMQKDIVYLLTKYLEQRDKLTEEEKRIILNTLRMVNISLEEGHK